MYDYSRTHLILRLLSVAIIHWEQAVSTETFICVHWYRPHSVFSQNHQQVTHAYQRLCCHSPLTTIFFQLLLFAAVLSNESILSALSQYKSFISSETLQYFIHMFTL